MGSSHSPNEFLDYIEDDECFYCLGGPEHLENEINEILGSKREDRFSNTFFEVVPKTCQVCFSYLLGHNNSCKGLRTLQKFPQKC